MAFASEKGLPAPLGSHYQKHSDKQGCNFAVTSSSATRMWVCLFEGDREYQLPMQKTGDVWHLFVADVHYGQQYGYRADGSWNPKQGLYLNPTKLLQDPYAHDVQGNFEWHQSIHSEYSDTPDIRNDEDSAPYVPRSIVTDHCFNWEEDQHTQIDDNDRVIYELHAKGFTKLFSRIPEEYKGTYLGLIQPAVVQYLLDLGVTTIELLPITQFLDEAHLSELNLPNYWGYNPLCMMAPDARYAMKDPVTEFKAMVKGLHAAGFEVIMDVVYNHTAEAGANGAQLCYKGLDNEVYYRLDPENPSEYLNYSFCGNSMRTEHPVTHQLVMDTLRHWVDIYHIDGFRFDLAPSLARQGDKVLKQNPFFDACQNDPVLSKRLLVAEPWDIGPDGYALGDFPEPWSEWNDKFRDPARSFWRGDIKFKSAFADALCGTANIFHPETRRSTAAVNYITAHDGYSLEDVVSYEQRHNQANGENNKDGHEPNYSRNYGKEGVTENLDILRRRMTAKRSMMASLILAKGTPMLLAGDEFGNSQKGNNNAYCQDNATSWLNWDLLGAGQENEFFSFVQKMLGLRKEFGWVEGIAHDHNSDAQWLSLSGNEMQSSDWLESEATGFAVTWHNTKGKFMLLMNNSDQSVDCQWLKNSSWQCLVNTASNQPFTDNDLTELKATGLKWLYTPYEF